MKKNMNIFMIVLFAITMAIIPFVNAEELEISDEELVEEIETMGIEERAEYRFEQLAISLENQIEYGKDILTELNISEDIMSELEGYIVELDVLLDRVNYVDLESSAADLAAEFLSIRDESKNISVNFKNLLNKEVTSDMIEEIKSNIAEMKELRQEEARLRIQEKKAEASTKQGARLLERIGIEVEGNFTGKEFANLVKENLANLSEEEKAELRDQVQEERDEAREEIEAKKAEAKSEMAQSKAEIKSEMAEKKSQKMNQFKVEMNAKKAETKGNITEVKFEISQSKSRKDNKANS